MHSNNAYPLTSWLAMIIMACVLSSCATSTKNIQPQINSLVIAQRFDRAAQYLDEGPHVYGPHNELLYWLDRGMLLHLAGRYRDSISAFENAKLRFDALYSRSLTQAMATVVGNDMWDDYRGEDYEYVLINIFQALNFVLLEDINEALVEARDVERQLALINSRYGPGEVNAYRDDAFAHLLMGILYEETRNFDDARISYVKAQDVYRDYDQNYGVKAPDLLEAHLSQLGQLTSKSRVYVIEYVGFVPVKIAGGLPVPLGQGHITQVTFPKHIDRFSDTTQSYSIAKGPWAEFVMPMVVSQPVGDIAKKVLDHRKAWVLAKGIIRPGLKYVAQSTVENQLRKSSGEAAADAVKILGNIYNLATEQPDVRSWQTLPNEIRISEHQLEPGTYEFFIEDTDAHGTRWPKRSLGVFELKAGRSKFLVTRSFR